MNTYGVGKKGIRRVFTNFVISSSACAYAAPGNLISYSFEKRHSKYKTKPFPITKRGFFAFDKASATFFKFSGLVNGLENSKTSVCY